MAAVNQVSMSVLFYEKPGCINNTKQKQLLRQTGYELDVRDLLKENWSPLVLKYFLDARGPDHWVNTSHPGVKSQSLDLPMDDESALVQMLCDDPLLIRRPLMRIENQFYQGFDKEQLSTVSGLSSLSNDLETCPRNNAE